MDLINWRVSYCNSDQFLKSGKSLYGFRLVLVFILLVSVNSIIAQPADRVISLAPSVTETIYLVGGESKLVGCTRFCTQAVDDGIDQVGSAIDVNIEKIFALQPDIVLAMQLTRQQDLEALNKLNIKVVVIPTPKSFKEICEQTLQIGEILGKVAEAKNVIRKSEDRVEEIRLKCRDLPRKRIFFQIGASPIFTVLENTFMNDFILFTRGENISNGLSHGTMTRESVLAARPDVIIVATMGGFGEEEQKNWMSYSTVPAVKNRSVFLIPSETSCSPTPVNFVKALEDVYSFINK